MTGDGERRPYAGKSDGAKSFGKKPYAGAGKPYAGKRDGDDRPPRRDFGDAPRPRGDRPFAGRPSRGDDGEKRSFKPREDRGGGEKRPFKPRGDRPNFNRDDRPPRRSQATLGIATMRVRLDVLPTGNLATRSPIPREKVAARSGPIRRAAKVFAKTATVRVAIGPLAPGRRAMAIVPAVIGPRENLAATRSSRAVRPIAARARILVIARSWSDRGDSKPWQKREDRGERDSRPARDGARNFDKPRFDRPRDDRGGEERPRFSRSREDRPTGSPKFDRPRADDRAKAAPTGRSIRAAKRVTIGRAARTRTTARFSQNVRRSAAVAPIASARPNSKSARRSRRKVKKSGERIAKVVARAGLASRRDAEEWITQGRVTVNGRVINSPALDVTANDVIAVDGKPLPPRERTRLFMFHKPRGLMTTHADPEGRPTVFDNLPEGLPRLISIGRLDFNTEGLLLLTNDGGLARALELPDTGWLRRYRVRAHGEVTQAQLDELKKGVEVDGVKYGSIDATLERDQGANVWLVFAIREGKNREVRNVMAHLGLEVNRLIRVSYGPFQLGELAEGQVEEVKTRVLREQLGEKIATLAGADFNRPMPGEKSDEKSDDEETDAPRGKKPFKPAGKSALIADRKGRRVLVQRTGSEEARARNEEEANGYGPPRRPQRGYHGKRDLKPRDE